MEMLASMDTRCHWCLTIALAIALTPGTVRSQTNKHVDFPLANHPVIPGEAFFKPGSVEAGELLLGALNCVSCHDADAAVAARIQPKQSPLLGDVASRVTPQYLRAWLTDPQAVKPGTTMPDVFHASEAQSRDSAVDYLMHFLLSQGRAMDKATIAADPAMILQGQELYHTVGCVACHAPQEPASKFNKELAAGAYGDGDGGDDDAPKQAAKIERPSVPLGKDLAKKTTLDALAAFLLDPLKHRPSGRMPNLLLSEREANAIAAYLLREQADAPGVDTLAAGLRYEYFEATFGNDRPDLDKLTPKSSGVIDRFTIDLPRRGNDFAFRFTGVIMVPEDGEYTFYTRSDDGSWLYIDGKLVVDNGGIHGAQERSGRVELKAGSHSIRVEMYEAAGEESLVVEWNPPGRGQGAGKQAIPAALLAHAGKAFQPLGQEEFAANAQKAAFGQRMFAMLRCAQCHQLEAGQQIPPFQPIRKLAQLDAGNDAGCIGKATRKGLPKYDLSDEQRASLVAAIKAVADGKLSQKREGEAEVKHTFAALNCFACHERGGAGGPEAGRAAYFRINGEAELGDEGRLPPTLTGIGGKLKPEALAGILTTTQWRVRPYMATRMPHFGEANVAHLPPLLDKLDSPANPVKEPQLSGPIAEVGRTLVGTGGFGCVNCHNVAGQRSLGVPAVDLAAVYSRVKADWYLQFMTDPASINKRTRMPQFWPDGKSPFPKIYDGDVRRQQWAMWNYMSLGKSMPRPPGMGDTGGYELAPAERPVVFRTFMNDVGPRAIVVGYPQRMNVAFDANVVRMAKAWRGRFFDASGTWEGRAGVFKGPLGEDVIDLPPGPAFAIAGQDFAKVEKTSRSVGGEFKGYRLDEQQRPIFRYEFGGYEIEEQAAPLIKPGGAVLVRRFALKSLGLPVTPVRFRAAVGKTIEQQKDGAWLVDGKVKLRFGTDMPVTLTPKVEDAGGGMKQLVLALPVRDAKASFEVEMDW